MCDAPPSPSRPARERDGGAGISSRRTFLGRSAWAAAGLAFPNLMPASAISSGGQSPPSERIRMGFIGLGGQGTGHLLGGAWTYEPGGFVARGDVQVLAVCDVRRERREFARERANAMYAERFARGGYAGVQAYNDFREVLTRPDIDAVLLALPYHWAAPMSIMAMRAGKDVYCEKPAAITVRESRVLVDTARRYGRIYQVGTQQRSAYGGRFRQACEWIRNGRIGQLKEVYAYRQPGAFFPGVWTSDQSVPGPEGFDWDLWLGPLPWRPYNGEAGHTLPGLFVGDVNWSPHHYDFVHWVVNPDPSAPIDVEYRDGQIQYHYPHGVVVHAIGYPGESVGSEGGACFVGTKGRLAVDRNHLVAYPERILRQRLRGNKKRVYFSDSHAGNFLDGIRTRRPTICNPEVAAAGIRTVLIGGIALALKRTVRWDPSTLEFPGDDAANRLLAYAHRPPWQM